MLNRFAFLLLFVGLTACGKDSAGPKGAADPYVIVGTSIALHGVFPDSVLQPRATTTDSFWNPVYVISRVRNLQVGDEWQDSSAGRSLTFCYSAFTSAGVVQTAILAFDYTIVVSHQRTGERDAAGFFGWQQDTLGHYVAGPLDPFDSPVVDWGADPQHVLRWVMSIDSLSSRAPVPLIITATPLEGVTFPSIPDRDYCP